MRPCRYPQVFLELFPNTDILIRVGRMSIKILLNSLKRMVLIMNSHVFDTPQQNSVVERKKKKGPLLKTIREFLFKLLSQLSIPKSGEAISTATEHQSIIFNLSYFTWYITRSLTAKGWHKIFHARSKSTSS